MKRGYHQKRGDLSEKLMMLSMMQLLVSSQGAGDPMWWRDCSRFIATFRWNSPLKDVIFYKIASSRFHNLWCGRLNWAEHEEKLKKDLHFQILIFRHSINRLSEWEVIIRLAAECRSIWIFRHFSIFLWLIEAGSKYTGLRIKVTYSRKLKLTALCLGS